MYVMQIYSYYLSTHVGIKMYYFSGLITQLQNVPPCHAYVPYAREVPPMEMP